METERYIGRFEADHGPHAAKELQRFLMPFVEYVGSRRITPAILDDFSTGLRKRGLKPASANRIIGTVKAYLRWLRKRGETDLTRDDLDDWKRYKVDKPQPKVLTTEQVRALLTAAAGTHRSAIRWSLYVSMGLGLGARHSELCSIWHSDVNTETKEVLVKGTKTGVERRVPYQFSPAMRRILEHAKARQQWRAFVPVLRCESWYNLCDQAGIGKQPRSILRSTAAAYVASGSGLSEYLLTQWFGHGSDVAARHYRQPMNNVKGDTLEEWYDAVDAFGLVADRIEAYRWQKGK